MIELSIDQKTYGTTFELAHIQLNITPGNVLLLLGHNGSGKTTIIKSLLGLTEYKGACRLDGREIAYDNTDDIDFLKKNVSYIADNASLFDFLSPEEIFNLTKSMHGENVDDSYLNGLIKLFEIDPYLNIPISDLSYGNKKKVQIVNQLFWKPRFLIFDEPTNGLDPDMVIVLKKVLQVVKESGTGILLSTHNLSFGQDLMDHTIIIRNGRELLNMEKSKMEMEFVEMDMEKVYQKVNKHYYQEIEGMIHELRL